MNYKHLISVLIPTRSRVALLEDCIESFLKNTMDHSRVELLFKVDFDDLDTIKFFESNRLSINYKVLISDREHGYGSLHSHYNDLAKLSKSEFLMIFNDDIEMLTPNWDSVVSKFSGRSFVLAVRNQRIRNGLTSPIFENYNGNPIIPFAIFSHTGALSHHPMVDDWWVMVSRYLKTQNFNIERWIDVDLLFKRPDGVETDLPADATFIEGRAHINWSHHNSPELINYTNQVISYVNNNRHLFVEPPF